MDFKVKCKEVENKDDHYDLTIQTYKDKIEGIYIQCGRVI